MFPPLAFLLYSMRRFLSVFLLFLLPVLAIAQGFNSKGGSHRGYQTPYTEQEQQPSYWSGSGIALNSKVFATNNHVVDGATHLYVYFPETKEKYTAQTIKADPTSDLAIVRITDPRFKGFPAIQYGFKQTIEDVGTDVFVLGYPRVDTMGEEVKLTTGVVSSRSGFQGNQTQYQVSAPVQPGNSGGPLFNDSGELIGIVSAKHTDGAENVSYAVKLSYLNDLIASSGESISLTKSSQIASQKLSEKCKAVIPCTVMVIADNERDGRTSKPSTTGFAERYTTKDHVQSRFIIKTAYVRGKDLSEYYRDADAYIVLYDEDETACMAIVMTKKNSQSYGIVTDMEVQHFEATSYSYERDVIKFIWNYKNSYDNNKGEANCRFDVTYKGNEVLFELEYVLSNGDMSRFTGSI